MFDTDADAPIAASNDPAAPVPAPPDAASAAPSEPAAANDPPAPAGDPPAAQSSGASAEAAAPDAGAKPDADAGAAETPAPIIASFAVAPLEDDGVQHLPDSLQLETGKPAKLSWSVTNAESVELAGVDESPRAITDGTTSLTLTPANDTNDYTLVAISGSVRSQPATVHISTHPPDECVSPHAEVSPIPRILSFQAMPRDRSLPPGEVIGVGMNGVFTLGWTYWGDGELKLTQGAIDLPLPIATETTNDDGTRSNTVDVAFSPPGGVTQLTYRLTFTPAGSFDALPALVTVNLEGPATADPKMITGVDLTADGPFTFLQEGLDKKGQPSIEFGMRCYQALLQWELSEDGTSGVGYSNDFDDWFAHGKSTYRNEWPDLTAVVPADKQSDTKDKLKKAATVFGCEWTFSNFVNCCNSQIAALFYALAGKTFSVKVTDGGVIKYDPLNAKTAPTTKVCTGNKDGANGKVITENNISIFQALFASNVHYYKEDKSAPLWAETNAFPRPGTSAALSFLGLSAEISPYAKSDEMRRLMRIGDNCASPGHAWLCGEVRYRVTFTDSPHGKPEIFIDQSSFLRAEQGEAIPIAGPDGKARRADDRSLGIKLTADDCELARRCEDDFLARVDAFLHKDKPDATDSTLTVSGKSRTVKKIEVADAYVFSANIAPLGAARTRNGTVGDWTVVDGKNVWKVSKEESKKWAYRTGISRIWDMPTTKPFAIMRFYPTDARPQQMKLPAGKATA